MDKAFIEKMKQELLRMKEEILQHLVEESNEFKKIVEDMDPKDLVDIASDDIGKKTLEAMGAVETRMFHQIEGALGRIENNRYGHCQECGIEVPRARLEAVPFTPFCVNCQADLERQRRRSS